jgi:hypothetical protein
VGAAAIVKLLLAAGAELTLEVLLAAGQTKASRCCGRRVARLTRRSS